MKIIVRCAARLFLKARGRRDLLDEGGMPMLIYNDVGVKRYFAP